MTGANRIDGGACNVFVLLPVAAADADATDTFTFKEDGETALHSCPPGRAGGQGKTNGVQSVQILSLSAARRGRAPI